MNLYISSLYGVIYIECSVEINLINIRLIMICISYSTTSCHFVHFVGLLLDLYSRYSWDYIRDSGYTNILQDKTLFCAFLGRWYCLLIGQGLGLASRASACLHHLPIPKVDLFKTANCRWICKTYVEYCYRHSATVCRLVQSPTLQ